MISTYTLNHFGIVAGICQELQLCHTIDALIPPDPQQTVTTGQAVVAMIINGLGFLNRTLYLFPQFFENKPVDLLIGKGLKAEKLNDDTIGRTLDIQTRVLFVKAVFQEKGHQLNVHFTSRDWLFYYEEEIHLN